MKKFIKDLATELHIGEIESRDGKWDKVNEIMKISTLKQIIREIILEVSERDIKMTHPKPYMPAHRNDQNIPDFSKMTLDNIKSIREKAKRAIEYYRNIRDEQSEENLKREFRLYRLCDEELKRRLHYINKPINENQSETPSDVKSEHFVVKFGTPEITKGSGKILFGDVWFANAVYFGADWSPIKKAGWLINRHTGAVEMGLPSVNIQFDTVKNLLGYLEKWLKTKSIKEERHNQVSNQSQCTGISHGVSDDTHDIQRVRDPLNDPRLNNKLDEEQYQFDDFGELAKGTGFGVPSTVYYGTIALGVIVSDKDGYMISTVKGPVGDITYKPSPNNKFKTKNLAAEVLHRTWKSLRHGEETKSF